MPSGAGEPAAVVADERTAEAVRIPLARRSVEALPTASSLRKLAQTTDASTTPIATWFRKWGFWLELVVSVIAGSAVIALGQPRYAVTAGLTLGVWIVANFHIGPAITSPLPKQMRIVARSVLLPMTALVFTVGFFGASPEAIPVTTLAVIVGASVSIVFRALRWQIQSPIRVLIVGDTLAISSAISRWAGQDRVNPVAALLLEPEVDEVPAEIMGVPVITGLSVAPQAVHAFRADLVLVSPGLGFTSNDMRRLAWSLESTKAALGVSGVLDSVAPHRITPGLMLGSTVTDVRSARPSMWVRASKAVADRFLALLMLLVASPVMLGMALAIRLDSKGTALFRQTRVGKDGREFTVFKMRTMYVDAEQRLAELRSDNECDDVLFKMKNDPRVTRIGRVLRRTSLDELPQLLNVVRGDMSLVGPRPALPAEVEEMDEERLRRLAVRPGITGLWQISGRSELSSEQASALDSYYADNWHLTGDVSILVRTVKAVLGAKGAY